MFNAREEFNKFVNEYLNKYLVEDDKDKRNGYGNIHLYHKENDEWVEGDMFFTIWSSAGSADKIMWPYIR